MTSERHALEAWLETPPGEYLLAWEQAHIDRAVADLFGVHALQIGLPELDALRANRMQHRWCASDRDLVEQPDGAAVVNVLCEFDVLPFADQSLDLVILPHSLEMATDAHQCLREVERVLRPEGRVVVIGFNPASLWGLRQRLGWCWRRLGGSGALFLPREGEFIAHRRLRDWMRLLGLEVEAGRFGCYRPALFSPRWLARFAWMEASGDRWWPVLGAVYLLTAVKRVKGMRLVGLVRRGHKPVGAAAAVVTQRQGPL